MASSSSTAFDFIDSQLTADSDLDDSSVYSSEDEYLPALQIDESGDDDHIAETGYGVEWRAVFDAPHGTPQPFVGHSGVQIPFAEKATALEVFQAFLSEGFVQKIVECTNLYAATLLAQSEIPEQSRIRQWHNTEVSEIYQFLGLIILMGINRKPCIDHYFSNDDVFGHPFFRKVMTGRRFRLLLSCLHFSESMPVAGDRIQKIRLIINHFRRMFSSVYVPGENICMDESLMLWKGRLGSRQHMKSKRARFDIKSYEICESTTGYVFDFYVYTEKDTEYTCTGGNLEEKMVLTLLEPLLGKYYKLYTDRFFTSPTLARTLLANNTYICGAVMGNRKDMPKKFPGKTLNPGQLSVVHNDGISCFAWQDKKEILMLSTMHHDRTITNAGIINYKTKQPILKPACICDYNKYMGGVVLCDNLTTAYPSMRKTVKWYKKVFFHSLNIALHNACVVYKKHTGKSITLLDFRTAVIRQIFEKYHDVNNSKDGHHSAPLPPSRLMGKHFIAVFPRIDPTKQTPRKRCRVCANNKINKKTRHECPTCEVPLCLTPCFEIFHSKQTL